MRDCLHWSAHGRDGRALPEHPGPNLRIVHRLYVLDVDRDEPGGADLPDPPGSHPMGRPGRVSGTLRLTGPSRVRSNGSCAEDGNDGSQAATTATPQLIMLPDGSSGGAGAGPRRRDGSIAGRTGSVSTSCSWRSGPASGRAPFRPGSWLDRRPRASAGGRGHGGAPMTGPTKTEHHGLVRRAYQVMRLPPPIDDPLFSSRAQAACYLGAWGLDRHPPHLLAPHRHRPVDLRGGHHRRFAPLLRRDRPAHRNGDRCAPPAPALPRQHHPAPGHGVVAGPLGPCRPADLAAGTAASRLARAPPPHQHPPATRTRPMTPAPAARQRWNTPRRPQVTGEGQPDAHTDPSREPALDPAPAADVISCSTILDRAEIQLRDGSWAGAQVTGQRQDAGGRLRMLLWWYASPVAGGRAGWCLYDANHVWRLG